MIVHGENPTKLTQIWVLWATLDVKKSKNWKKAKKNFKGQSKGRICKNIRFSHFFCFLGSIEDINSCNSIYLFFWGHKGQKGQTKTTKATIVAQTLKTWCSTTKLPTYKWHELWHTHESWQFSKLNFVSKKVYRKIRRGDLAVNSQYFLCIITLFKDCYKLYRLALTSVLCTVSILTLTTHFNHISKQ